MPTFDTESTVEYEVIFFIPEVVNKGHDFNYDKEGNSLNRHTSYEDCEKYGLRLMATGHLPCFSISKMFVKKA